MQDTQRIGDQAVEIANKINEACEGRHSAAVYLGIGMVIGYSASLAERPDLTGLMALIERCAREEFERRLTGR